MTIKEYDSARKSSMEQVYINLLDELVRFGFLSSQVDSSTIFVDRRVYEVLSCIYEPMRLFKEHANNPSRGG